MGLEKDLDDLATEARPAVTCDLIKNIEEELTKLIKEDCGPEFSQLLVWAWSRTKTSIQKISREVDTSSISDEQGNDEVRRLFTIPMLSGLLQLIGSSHAAAPPIDNNWFKSPFSAWVQWVSSSFNIDKKLLLERISLYCDVDKRSIDRWLTGTVIHELRWPYLPAVEASINTNDSQTLIDKTTINQLTCWLTIALSYQALSSVDRDDIRKNLILRAKQEWAIEHSIAELQQQAINAGIRKFRTNAISVCKKIAEQLQSKTKNFDVISNDLDSLQKLIRLEPKFWQRSIQFIHSSYSARLAAMVDKKEDALRLYAEAVEGAWWYAGPHQRTILSDALLYSVGIGDITSAKR